jgi:predicted negative regulator of RcsB-dependent stress response
MTHSKEIINMKKFAAFAVVLVLGILVLTGFSMDNQSLKKAPQTISASVDYANFTQYMQ